MKSRTTKKELQKAALRLKEIQEMNELAEAEDQATLKKAEDNINELCEASGLTCGIIITPDDLPSLVKMMIDKKGSVAVPFKIWFKNEEE